MLWLAHFTLYMNTSALQQEGQEEKADEPRIVQYVQRKKPSLFKVYKGEFWVVLHRYTLQRSALHYRDSLDRVVASYWYRVLRLSAASIIIYPSAIGATQ
jgi:hypothetical protein